MSDGTRRPGHANTPHRGRSERERDIESGPGDPYADADWQDDEDLHPPKRRRPLWLRLVAALVTLAVGLFLLGGVVRMLTVPPLGFLREALRLAEDPDVRRWEAAVVRVRATQPGRGSTGTGFNARSSGLVVTNRHVVSAASLVEVRFREGDAYPAAGVRLAPSTDLALLRLQARGLPTVPLAQPAPAAPGTAVTVVGNPLGYAGLAVRGTINRYVSGGAGPIMEIDAPIHRGHSGSPVFDDEGRVVGVIFAATPADEQHERRGYAVPVAAVHRLLELLDSETSP